MDVEWTVNQRKIHDLENYRNGKIIVKACPGSGKTLCVSERIIKFISQHESPYFGLAITSFTNVAVDEIKRNYEEETSQKIRFPHYIGTFDSFINNFIFLPFGHLVMKCKKRPVLVGEPYSKWHHKNHRCEYFDKISFDKKGKIYRIQGKFILTGDIRSCKKRLIRKGYATQDDANYFSMRILEKFPEIARAIINKFPYLIIDEAQDLSEIQMEILNILIKNGLNNILMVGDPDQSIFEWRTAKPELFLEKFNNWGDEYGSAIELDSTFRCCENISRYLSIISGNEINSCVKDSINLMPELSSHDGNYKQLVDDFINKVKVNLDENIDKEDVAILFRSRNELNKFMSGKGNKLNFTNIFKSSDQDISNFKERLGRDLEISDKKDIQNYTENIIKGHHYFLKDNFILGFKEFEKAFIKISTKEFNNIRSSINESISKNGFYNHRKSVWKFIKLFEKPNGSDQLVDEWIDMNNNKFSSEGIGFYLNKIKIRDKSSKINLNELLTWDRLSFDANEANLEYYCGTIHSVKGRSFDAVLLILKSHCKNDLGEDLMKNTELRNVYVGMSRARHFLEIAVPSPDLETWENYFESGFKQASLDSFF